MHEHPVLSGYIPSQGAQIWFEAQGDGRPLILLHAGVADSRQWDHAASSFRDRYRVVRYDLRGHGRSEPADSSFRHIEDLRNVLDAVGVCTPAIFVGCSMGGGLALDFALEYPDRVAALVLCGSGPNGLSLDAPRPKLMDAIREADERADLEALAELETQLWFDGEGRNAATIDTAQRALAKAMNRQVLMHDLKGLGTRLPDSTTPAAERMAQLRCPLLLIVGRHDIPFIHAAAAFMQAKRPDAVRVDLDDAAHLANMDRPEEFAAAVTAFLDSLGL